MTTTLSERRPIARKWHECDWCGQAIIPGQRYVVWCGIYEGDFRYTRMHEGCAAAMHRGGEYDYSPGDNPYGRTHVETGE